MSHATFIFTETSPASPTTSLSTQPVQGAASYLPVGQAGPFGDYSAVDVIGEIKGATGGVLDVYVQSSPDEGLSWFDIIKFPRMAAGQAVAYFQAPVSLATNTSTPQVVGKNSVPALAVGVSAGAVVNGAFSDRMRLCMVAGVSTTAGAQIVVRLSAQRSNRSMG